MTVREPTPEELKAYGDLSDRVVDREKLRGWLSASKEAGDTHLFVIAVTDGTEYTLGVKKGEDPREIHGLFYKNEDSYWTTKVIALYNHGLDHEFQMTMRRPMVWELEMTVGITLDRLQYERWLRWTEEVRAKAVAKQNTGERMKRMTGGGPYYGAVGGGYTWKITHTTIGTIVVCTEAITGEEIDLTDM